MYRDDPRDAERQDRQQQDGPRPAPAQPASAQPAPAMSRPNGQADGHQDRDSIGLALVRWGLLISLSLAILALGAIWITGALITPGHASAAMAEAGLNDVGPTKNGASRAMHETEHQPSP